MLNKILQELKILQAKNAFIKNWLNNSLSNSNILFQKIGVPTKFYYITSIEQRVLDLLYDNDSYKIPSSHIHYDEKFHISIFQKWSFIPQLIEFSHQNRPPKMTELAVMNDLRRAGQTDTLKNNILLVIAGIIPLDALKMLSNS